MVFAMELLPVPALPVSQQILYVPGSLTHVLISPKIPLRVPSMQPGFKLRVLNSLRNVALLQRYCKSATRPSDAVQTSVSPDVIRSF